MKGKCVDDHAGVRRPFTSGLAACVLGLGLSGCLSLGPDHAPPDPGLGEAWQQELRHGLQAGPADLRAWWTAFGDADLEALITAAIAGNLDLEAARARVLQAQAWRAVAAGERWPAAQTQGTAQRQRPSEDYLIPTVAQERTDWYYRLGLAAGWEVDFWGRIRRAVEAADADAAAVAEARRGLQVLVCAETAAAYTELRTAEGRLQVAQDNAAAQRESLALARDRLAAGLTSELDLRQAEMNLAVTDSMIPHLQAARERALRRLALLCGRLPGDPAVPLTPGQAVPAVPEHLAVGIPADLARQRPDIRAAERRLAAATARIGMTAADLYPRLTLSGTFAFDGTGDILDFSRRSWSLGPALTWNAFSGGRVRAAVRRARAAAQEAEVAYRQTVLRAVEEVENALSDYAFERDRAAALQRSVEAARAAVALVQDQYRSGLTDFQNVLDMQRHLYAQQDRFVESQGLVAGNLIRVYRALGGGWTSVAPN